MAGILDVCDVLRLGDGAGPLTADFIGRGNIWIDNTYDESVTGLAKLVIAKAFGGTAPGQLSVIGYDSDLSGVFAPFASLSAGGSRTLTLVEGRQGFRAALDRLRRQIMAVQNVVQGRSRSLLEFRKATGRPIEGYTLVVLSLDMGLIDNETRAALSLLMRQGPACGVSFLVVSTTLMTIQTQGDREVELSVEAIAPNITVLEADGATVTDVASGRSARFTPPAAQDLVDMCSDYIGAARSAQLPTVRFDEICDTKRMWRDTTIDGFTFALGMYGVTTMNVTMGDEANQRHNAIVTGAVGQGKSNLISVIVHSLCQRYSPHELQMYLLDFKEGVTFKAFSDIGHDDYLPHARALGLESDPGFGLAVLEDLFKEYRRRMRLLKDANVKSIREYRLQNPDVEMPRILVVIDEFQLMFDDKRVDRQIADLLEKAVRLFRAAGIHFILASQTLSDTGSMALMEKKSSLFSQVPIRIALKNSEEESRQTLGMDNNAAAFLRPREAIVNLDYGEVSQNRTTVVAYADEKVLQPLRRVWWEKARREFGAPYVFESERRITVRNGIDSVARLRRQGTAPFAVLGERVSIDGESVAVPMTRESGRNIAIIGTPDRECDNANGMLQTAAVSLAAQHPRGDARFLFCDFTAGGQPYDARFPLFASLMEAMGYFIECVEPTMFQETFQGLAAEAGGDTGAEQAYLFGVGLDRWEYEKDPYGGGSPLKEFVETGPARGLHLIGWWQKAARFTEQVAGIGDAEAFNTRVFLRVDERTVQSMTSPFIHWTPQSNRALASDSVEFSEPFSFIPYAPVAQGDVAAFRSQVWD